MKLDVYNLANEKVGEIDVSERVFGADVKPHLFYEVVRMQLANRRRGTHKTKTRSEVRGGGRKPYRQKGTGRARQGSIRAPHWVGGGHAHAKTPRDYGFKLNKKKRRGALRSALSMLVAEQKLKVVDAFELDAIGTQQALATLDTLGVARALVVDGGDARVVTAKPIAPFTSKAKGKRKRRLQEKKHNKRVARASARANQTHHLTSDNETLQRSVHNLKNYKYLRPEGVNVRDVLHYGAVIVTREALRGLETRLER